nr:hypothetical protein [Tanacetum cinerariifolium]
MQSTKSQKYGEEQEQIRQVHSTITRTSAEPNAEQTKPGGTKTCGLGFGWLEMGFLMYCDERVFGICDAQKEALLMI